MFNSLLRLIHIIVFKVELPLTRYHLNSEVLTFKVSTYIFTMHISLQYFFFFPNMEEPLLGIYDNCHLSAPKQQQSHCAGFQS